MRDAKLTFSFAAVGGTADQLTVVAPGSVNGVVQLTFASTTGTPRATSAVLDYGGLVMNGVSGAVMDGNADGSVTNADYVRGQILNPLYVLFAGNYTNLTAADTVTIELHGSDTLAFTPSAATLLSSAVHTVAAAAGDEMLVLPLQSYAKFLRLRITFSAIRATGVFNITRMHIQNGREGVI
jgi:hypothetical protein